MRAGQLDMPQQALRIGELAAATGTTAPTIRYYEAIGLLPNPSRVGGQRRYHDDDVRRVKFIRRCRDFGFSVEQVGQIAELAQDDTRSCLEARELAENHLAAIRAKLADLHALEASITKLVEAADAGCDGGPGSECIVFERLSQLPVR